MVLRTKDGSRSTARHSRSVLVIRLQIRNQRKRDKRPFRPRSRDTAIFEFLRWEILWPICRSRLTSFFNHLGSRSSLILERCQRGRLLDHQGVQTYGIDELTKLFAQIRVLDGLFPLVLVCPDQSVHLCVEICADPKFISEDDTAQFLTVSSAQTTRQGNKARPSPRVVGLTYLDTAFEALHPWSSPNQPIGSSNV